MRMTATVRAEALAYDLRFALRALARRPALAAIATLSLATGIAINVAFFTVLNAMLARDLGVPDADSLVLVGSPALTLAQQEALAEAVAPRAEVFAFRPSGTARLEGGAEVATEVVTDAYFPALGLRPAAGRLFERGEDAGPRVVLSDSLWSRAFGRDPGVVGRDVRVGGKRLRVAGVAPHGFRGLVPFAPADVWSVASRALEGREGAAAWPTTVARPRSGLAPKEVRAALQAAIPRLPGMESEAARRFVHVDVLGDLERVVWLLVAVLMAVPGLVLLVACANVSGLLAARGEERRGEMAIRLAMGGNRARLLRQLLCEGALLALGGAALGLLLGRWILDGVSPWLLPALGRFAMYPDLALDHRAVAVSLALAGAAALGSSLLPARAAARRDLTILLKREAGGPAGRFWRATSRDALVVAQLVVTFAFVVTASLCAQAFRDGVSVPLGFAPDRLLVGQVRVPAAGPTASQELDALLERVRQVPGVARATLAAVAPALPGPTRAIRAANAPAGSDPYTAAFNGVRPEYQAMIGLRLLEGRFVEEADVRGARAVAVVTAALAHRLWGDESPLGRTLRVVKEERDLAVVGVVDDPPQVAQVERRPGSRGDPMFYVPLDARFLAKGGAVLIVDGPRAALLAAPIERAVRRLSPDAAVVGMTTLAEVNRAGLVQADVTRLVYSLLAILCGVLGTIGLYGAVAQAVARRVPEIGLRMALGASRGDVLGLVLRRGLALGALGVALGVPAAFAAQRIFGSAVLDMPAVHLSPLASAAALVVAAALTASYVPARRASRVDPMVALRCE
jgi:putative ABC transport system permease protein